MKFLYFRNWQSQFESSYILDIDSLTFPETVLDMHMCACFTVCCKDIESKIVKQILKVRVCIADVESKDCGADIDSEMVR